MRKQRVRPFLWVMFGLYLFFISSLLVFLRFRYFSLPESFGAYREALGTHISLSPLHTIVEFVRLPVRHPALTGLAVRNLAGNLFLLTLPAFLWPCLCPRQRRFWKIMLASLLFVAAAETIQLFTLIGTFDIDDFILNLLGAALGYGLFRLPPVQRLLIRLDHAGKAPAAPPADK